MTILDNNIGWFQSTEKTVGINRTQKGSFLMGAMSTAVCTDFEIVDLQSFLRVIGSTKFEDRYGKKYRRDRYFVDYLT